MAENAALSVLLDALATNAAFREEVAQAARRHGVDLTGEELSDDDLERVAGGLTLSSFQSSLSTLQSGLQSTSGLQTLQMQSALQKQAQTVQMMSNVSNLLHSTSMSIIQNLR